ncbi:MAG: hypothetical protein AAF351_05940 [Pseudomonadota bacterium]
MRYVLVLVAVFLMTFSPESHAQQSVLDNDARDLVDYYEANGIPYVIMTRQHNGAQQLVIIALYGLGSDFVLGATTYDSFGMTVGALAPNPFEGLGDFIGRFNMSIDPSCEADPTCWGFANTSSGYGGP